jgi:hypothetical protein
MTEHKLLEKMLVEGKFECGQPIYCYSAEEAVRITEFGKKTLRSLLKLWNKHTEPKRRKGKNR